MTVTVNASSPSARSSAAVGTLAVCELEPARIAAVWTVSAAKIVFKSSSFAAGPLNR